MYTNGFYCRFIKKKKIILLFIINIKFNLAKRYTSTIFHKKKWVCASLIYSYSSVPADG